MSDPLLDPFPPHPEIVPTPGLWRNGAFLRVWAAATISVFGSFVTRIALPFVAILTLKAGPIDVAILRSLELVAALLVGFVAGAWVDRLRRRPVLIWADILRALLLGSIPVAAVGGWLTLPQVYLVAALAAVCTTFFDVADRAYLPTIVSRTELVRANGALSATSAAVEFAAFGVAGFLVTLLTAPIAILIDAVSFVVSAVLLGSIRRPEPPPPPAEDRDPVTSEIAEGLRLVVHDPVLRGLVGGVMGLAAMWGIFGATWLLFVTEELQLDPAIIGVIAALGGFGSLLGALLAERATTRFGVGTVVFVSMLGAGLGNLLIPLAPVGMPLIAVALLIGQQLIGDTAVTVFDVTEVSIRQARVADRQLGRVNATVRVAMVLAQLAATLAGGLVAEAIGLRAAAFLAPLGALAGATVIWRSPVRRLRRIEAARAEQP
ncbi:MAG TPA: MFS transporter [Candidatus Limnocylindrales bacterium]|nr:MFS transporter [Candidatus Limnocylindrales bacterium]